MNLPGPAALLQFAQLMNGECPKCRRILPHADSGRQHECPKEPAQYIRAGMAAHFVAKEPES